jgi:hypothetical protein
MSTAIHSCTCVCCSHRTQTWIFKLSWILESLSYHVIRTKVRNNQVSTSPQHFKTGRDLKKNYLTCLIYRMIPISKVLQFALKNFSSMNIWNSINKNNQYSLAITLALNKYMLGLACSKFPIVTLICIMRKQIRWKPILIILLYYNCPGREKAP